MAHWESEGYSSGEISMDRTIYQLDKFGEPSRMMDELQYEHRVAQELRAYHGAFTADSRQELQERFKSQWCRFAGYWNTQALRNNKRDCFIAAASDDPCMIYAGDNKVLSPLQYEGHREMWLVVTEEFAAARRAATQQVSQPAQSKQAMQLPPASDAHQTLKRQMQDLEERLEKVRTKKMPIFNPATHNMLKNALHAADRAMKDGGINAVTKERFGVVWEELALSNELQHGIDHPSSLKLAAYPSHFLRDRVKARPEYQEMLLISKPRAMIRNFWELLAMDISLEPTSFFARCAPPIRCAKITEWRRIDVYWDDELMKQLHIAQAKVIIAHNRWIDEDDGEEDWSEHKISPYSSPRGGAGFFPTNCCEIGKYAQDLNVDGAVIEPNSRSIASLMAFDYPKTYCGERSFITMPLIKTCEECFSLTTDEVFLPDAHLDLELNEGDGADVSGDPNDTTVPDTLAVSGWVNSAAEISMRPEKLRAFLKQNSEQRILFVDYMLKVCMSRQVGGAIRKKMWIQIAYLVKAMVRYDEHTAVSKVIKRGKSIDTKAKIEELLSGVTTLSVKPNAVRAYSGSGRVQAQKKQRNGEDQHLLNESSDAEAEATRNHERKGKARATETGNPTTNEDMSPLPAGDKSKTTSARKVAAVEKKAGSRRKAKKSRMSSNEAVTTGLVIESASDTRKRKAPQPPKVQQPPMQQLQPLLERPEAAVSEGSAEARAEPEAEDAPELSETEKGRLRKEANEINVIKEAIKNMSKIPEGAELHEHLPWPAPYPIKREDVYGQGKQGLPAGKTVADRTKKISNLSDEEQEWARICISKLPNKAIDPWTKQTYEPRKFVQSILWPYEYGAPLGRKEYRHNGMARERDLQYAKVFDMHFQKRMMLRVPSPFFNLHPVALGIPDWLWQYYMKHVHEKQWSADKWYNRWSYSRDRLRKRTTYADPIHGEDGKFAKTTGKSGDRSIIKKSMEHKIAMAMHPTHYHQTMLQHIHKGPLTKAHLNMKQDGRLSDLKKNEAEAFRMMIEKQVTSAEAEDRAIHFGRKSQAQVAGLKDENVELRRKLNAMTLSKERHSARKDKWREGFDETSAKLERNQLRAPAIVEDTDSEAEGDSDDPHLSIHQKDLVEDDLQLLAEHEIIGPDNAAINLREQLLTGDDEVDKKYRRAIVDALHQGNFVVSRIVRKYIRARREKASIGEGGDAEAEVEDNGDSDDESSEVPEDESETE